MRVDVVRVVCVVFVICVFVVVVVLPVEFVAVVFACSVTVRVSLIKLCERIAQICNHIEKHNFACACVRTQTLI